MRIAQTIIVRSYSLDIRLPSAEFSFSTIRLAADQIWGTLPVEAIDSIGEWVDDDISPPAARLFAYADGITEDMLPGRFDIEPLKRGFRLTRKQAEQDVDLNT